MPSLTESLDALASEARTAREYITYLEGQVVTIRRELQKATRNRPKIDERVGQVIHTGLTARVREILTQAPATRKEIATILDAEQIPYTSKGLGVMLSQKFVYTSTGRSEGYWSLKAPEEASNGH